jgi:isopentenyl diphosphate isomerase/L-lactate dehydrogenase-like FMN-dependent dehydrogenase
VYLDQNDTTTQDVFDSAAAAGAKAIIYTVDSAANGVRHRAARYGVGSADTAYSYITVRYLEALVLLATVVRG